jgi:endonuclease YncB( thermonuclease family)
MKKFTFPVILFIAILIVIFGSNFEKWPETANKTLSTVTTSIQKFLPEEATTNTVEFVQELLPSEAATNTVEFVQEFFPDEAATNTVEFVEGFFSEEVATNTVDFVEEFFPEEVATEAVALLESPQPFRKRRHVGKVTRIIDGDIIEVQAASGRKFRVRLIEIDTPEERQPWGSESRKALSNKVLQKRVEIYDQGTDRYSRKIGRVYFKDRDISRELVAEGHAWVNRLHKPDKSLIAAEESARSSRLGLWNLDNPIPPWTWKRGAKTDINPVSLNSECGLKQQCQEMTSCREAMFYFKKCRLSGLDSDSDGTPCESICIR